LNIGYGAQILVSDFWTSQGASGAVEIYALDKGLQTAYPTGHSYEGVQRSPDGKTFAYDAWPQNINSVIMVIGEQGVSMQYPIIPPDCGDNYCPVASYLLGNHHIAFRTDTQITIYNFRDTDAPPLSIELADQQFYGWTLFDDDRWMISKNSSRVTVWDLQAPDAAPITIETEYQRFKQFNDDLSHYAVQSADKQVIYATETGDILAELPLEAVINSTMTQAVWWEGGTVRVWDESVADITSIAVIDSYLGRAMALHAGTGIAAFVGDTFQVVNLTDQTASEVLLSAIPDYIEFTGEGTTFLAEGEFLTTEGEKFSAGLWKLEGGETVLPQSGASNFHISPSGDYVFSRDVPCFSQSEMGEFFGIFRLNPPYTPPPYYVWQSMVYMSGCGVSPVVFPNQTNRVYIGAQRWVIRVDLGSLTESITTFYEDEPTAHPYAVLDYRGTNRPFGVSGVGVSADERWLAVITLFNSSDKPVRLDQFTRQVELFDLNGEVFPYGDPDTLVKRVIHGATRAANHRWGISGDGYGHFSHRAWGRNHHAHHLTRLCPR